MPTLRPLHDDDPKRDRLYQQFRELTDELQTRELSGKSRDALRLAIETVNATADGNGLVKVVRKQQATLVRHIEKEDKIVPQKYYLKLWMALGLTAFGLPLGMTFALAIGNMGLMGIGFPIGIGLGVALGAQLDKKAEKEGRQLNTELKY